jgi:outer membrane autotransporter protein
VLFDFTASKNGNAVDLALAVPAGSSTGVVDAVTSTGNNPGAGAATVLDGLVADLAGGGTGNADMDSVIAVLGTLTTNQQISDTVSQMLPLMTGGMTQFTFSNLRGVNRVVQARLEANRGLSSGDDFVADRKAWIKPLGSWADQENRNGAFGYDAQTYGVALGADGELSEISRIGAAFAYTRSDVDSNSGAQTADVDSYLVVLYGSRNLDKNTELNWQADYGYNRNQGDRYIAFVDRTARSSYHSDSLHLGAGIGRMLPMSAKTSFTPSFRADYTTIKENGYTETGADALNLAVDGKTTDELILAVDGKVAHAVSDATTLTANLGIGYDTQAEQASITTSFAGGGAAFTTNGINPSSTVMRGGLGMVINSSDAMEFTARYDIETRSGYTGQTVSVKFRMPF